MARAIRMRCFCPWLSPCPVLPIFVLYFRGNEKVIQGNLEKFFKDKTVVIVAHRLSTVKNADQIVVLKEGEITEKGTHDELITRQGDYYRLVKNQLELSA